MPVTVQQIGKPTDGKTIGEWVKAAAIRAAEDTLRQEVAKGFDNKPVVVTDGVPRKDYNAVKPFGKIEFIRRPQMAEAALWALDALRKRSPIGPTHRYVQSHAVLLNKVSISGDLKAALLAVKETDRVQIVNTQPYARKIEGATASKKTGRSKRAALSKQAKGGVYRVVVRELVSRYGRSIFADFKYVKLEGGVKVWGAQGGGKGRKRVQRDQIYPSLNLFIKPTGLAN